MTCDEYLEDPEANAAHLATCEACRAMTEELDAGAGAGAGLQHRPISVDALPLAAWEGASHRTWPLVAAGAAAVLVLAVVLFIAAGVPPLRGVTGAVTTGVTSFEAAANFFRLFGSGIHSAPVGVHITIAVLFVVINTILFLLLRRAPKGIDV